MVFQPLFYALRFIQVVAFLCAVAELAVFVLALISVFNNFDAESEFSWYFMLSSLYGGLMCVLIILIEVRYGYLFDHMPGFKNWLIRGLYYIL